MSEFAQLLNQAGLKATAPRLALLEALRSSRSHPSAEDLHEQLRGDHPTLSLSTVYLGLEAFLTAGLCRRVRSKDGRMRVDGVPHPHDHAVCVQCREIFDVDLDLFPRPPSLPLLPGGLEVNAVRVEYEVTCATCRTAPAT